MRVRWERRGVEVRGVRKKWMEELKESMKGK